MKDIPSCSQILWKIGPDFLPQKVFIWFFSHTFYNEHSLLILVLKQMSYIGFEKNCGKKAENIFHQTQ